MGYDSFRKLAMNQVHESATDATFLMLLLHMVVDICISCLGFSLLSLFDNWKDEPAIACRSKRGTLRAVVSKIHTRQESRNEEQ